MVNLDPSIKVEFESVSVQAHLSIIQNVIQRMAANSAACKTWCITLVSAVLVMIADKGKVEYIYLALFPIVTFAVLDIYYLGLEKAFQNSYNLFISKLHTNNLTTQDLYAVKPVNKGLCLLMKCGISPSIWIFYLSLSILIFIMKWVVFGFN